MTTTPKTRFRILSILFLVLIAAANQPLPAQSSSDSSPGPNSAKILLVLPFDNQTPSAAAGQSSPTSVTSPTNSTSPTSPTSLDWLSEAVPEILDSRFTSAGLLPLTREDRVYALDHLGLPETFQPSRATAIRIAQTLDADDILYGSYTVADNKLTLKARIVDVAKFSLSEEVTESGSLPQLIPLLNSLAWQLTRKLDPTFSVAQETFRSADAKLRLDAFEQYIRGRTARDTDERLKHLKKATDLNPDFTPAWLAMGQLQFATQQYEQAAVSFARVTSKGAGSDPAELEAGFYRGLSLIFSGRYTAAEEAFATVARLLPLPEVVNNQGVAISRRGHDSAAVFVQAVAADPTDADYHFNLAVALHRHGDKAQAMNEMAQSLKLNPSDSEAKATQAAWQNPNDTSAEPLERIKRSYNGAAFRQAAQMLEQVESARLAALPAPERAAKLSRSAKEKLDRGLLLEAERGYRGALAADDHSAEAHAGLAEVRERAGDPAGSRKEAEVALDRQPNIEAFLVLARLDLAANRLPEAHEETEQALLLDPTNRPAKDLRKTIETRQQATPPPQSAQPAADPKTPTKP